MKDLISRNWTCGGWLLSDVELEACGIDDWLVLGPSTLL